jgi:hypothetical protein
MKTIPIVAKAELAKAYTTVYDPDQHKLLAVVRDDAFVEGKNYPNNIEIDRGLVLCNKMEYGDIIIHEQTSGLLLSDETGVSFFYAVRRPR